MTEVADDKPADMVDAGEHSEDHKEDDADKNENLSADFIEEIKEVFDMYDREKNQTIDVASLGTVLQWLKFNPTDTELREYA